MDKPKRKILQVKLLPEEFEILEKAAKKERFVGVSSYVRKVAVDKAKGKE